MRNYSGATARDAPIGKTQAERGWRLVRRAPGCEAPEARDRPGAQRGMAIALIGAGLFWLMIAAGVAWLLH